MRWWAPVPRWPVSTAISRDHRNPEIEFWALNRIRTLGLGTASIICLLLVGCAPSSPPRPGTIVVRPPSTGPEVGTAPTASTANHVHSLLPLPGQILIATHHGVLIAS